MEEDVSLFLLALNLKDTGAEGRYIAVAEWRSTLQGPWSCEESDCRGTHRLDSCMRSVGMLAGSVA